MKTEISTQPGTGQPVWYRTVSFTNFSSKLVIYIILCLFGTVVLVPFFWTLSTALKTVPQALAVPPIWIPNPPMWENFAKVIDVMSFWRAFNNTIAICSLEIVGQLISCSLVAYGFARLRFPGRDALFFICVSTMLIPSHVLIIPRFILFKELQWLDTFKPLVVPSFFGGAMNIFLLRQFFMTIPLELDDAAKIDGCGYFGTFTRIMLPLSKPVLAIVAIFTFMNNWKDFMGPLIYLNNPAKYTLSLALATFQTEGFVEWNLWMAAAFMTMIPPLVLFFFAQKYFIQGIVFTGVKG
jgi:multiple sugar transport system permease protein